MDFDLDLDDLNPNIMFGQLKKDQGFGFDKSTIDFKPLKYWDFK